MGTKKTTMSVAMAAMLTVGFLAVIPTASAHIPEQRCDESADDCQVPGMQTDCSTNVGCWSSAGQGFAGDLKDYAYAATVGHAWYVIWHCTMEDEPVCADDSEHDHDAHQH